MPTTPICLQPLGASDLPATLICLQHLGMPDAWSASDLPATLICLQPPRPMCSYGSWKNKKKLGFVLKCCSYLISSSIYFCFIPARKQHQDPWIPAPLFWWVSGGLKRADPLAGPKNFRFGRFLQSKIDKAEAGAPEPIFWAFRMSRSRLAISVLFFFRVSI